MPRSVPQIAVTIDFDADYNLTVSVFEKLSGREGKWIIPFDSTRYDVEYVWRVEEEGEKYQADDDAEKQRIEAINALVAYAYNLRKFLNENEDAIDASIKTSLDNKLTLVETWLNHNEAATRDMIESEQLELKSFVHLTNTKRGSKSPPSSPSRLCSNLSQPPPSYNGHVSFQLHNYLTAL
ncbi:70-kilodalton heat shock protein [Aphanomyces cochlioides]|nr:70-kilodalton heat shock protein [Aphanomyces cochlioides]